ncbi:MAG TPA: MBL fold metallo-hydrolase, partial [Ruminococcaceae bacterium]|nr:MBL fold metallo-hydrolase [Oscillospiraceae bacterium]
MELATVVVGALENNCYILSSRQKNAAVIDPGSQADKILAAINERNLTVKYIILTHGHYDHIGAVASIKERFADAEICIGEFDTELLRSDEKSLANFIRPGKKKDALSWDIEFED